MDAWADVEGAIQAAIQQRKNRLEKLVAISSITILLGAIWLVWPTLSAAAKGEAGLLNGLGMPILVLIWGLLVQDIGLTNPSSRTRIGASATIAWPVLMIIACKEITSIADVTVIGPLLVIIAAAACYLYSKTVLRGGLDVQRFRALMTGVGTIAALSIFIGNIPKPYSTTWLMAVGALSASASNTGYVWIAGDEQKTQRKAFKIRLDMLENRLLVLKSENAAVDQAASLIMTAREEGHADPEWGMRLLDDAEEDIARSLSLAGDVQIVKQDSEAAVEQAEEIAPSAKKARKAYDMGLREIELGSLREGEMLFRQAKKRAREVIEWWQKAEDAVATANHLLDGKTGDNINHLHEVLAEAKQCLAQEAPRKAFEYASTIPEQLSAEDSALKRAAESIKEAERQLDQTDGLDVSFLTTRIERAIKALEAGNAGQAIGLADGVVRNIEAERTAMDYTRRALKQKKQLIKQFENRSDSDRWNERLSAIVDSANEKQWTHAAALLERMTAELDKSGKEASEAKELLDFIKDEWKILRNQLEAAMVKVDDQERIDCEAAIAMAAEALATGEVEECLTNLTNADSLMEKLRRRV